MTPEEKLQAIVKAMRAEFVESTKHHRTMCKVYGSSSSPAEYWLGRCECIEAILNGLEETGVLTGELVTDWNALVAGANEEGAK